MGLGVLGVAPARAASWVPRGLMCPAPVASSCSPAPRAEALAFSGRGSWAPSVMRWSPPGLSVGRAVRGTALLCSPRRSSGWTDG